jgi:hypothetical protein
VRKVTKERRGFVSRSSPPTKERYVSVEELVRELSHNQVGSLSTPFVFSTKVIFSTKRQDHSPHKLAAAHHYLGS